VTTPAVTAMANARRNSIMFGSLVHGSEDASPSVEVPIPMSDLIDLHLMVFSPLLTSDNSRSRRP
jgi:hypothetical protein